MKYIAKQQNGAYSRLTEEEKDSVKKGIKFTGIAEFNSELARPEDKTLYFLVHPIKTMKESSLDTANRWEFVIPATEGKSIDLEDFLPNSPLAQILIVGGNFFEKLIRTFLDNNPKGYRACVFSHQDTPIPHYIDFSELTKWIIKDINPTKIILGGSQIRFDKNGKMLPGDKRRHGCVNSAYHWLRENKYKGQIVVAKNMVWGNADEIIDHSQKWSKDSVKHIDMQDIEEKQIEDVPL